MRSEDVLALIAVFAPLSLVAIGGMISVLPSIQYQVVEVHHWVTAQEFVDMFAISRAAPGPGTMIVTLIGWKVGGWTGAIVATAAAYVPSTILALVVARLWNRYRGRKWHEALQNGLAPVAAALLLAGIVSLIRTAGAGPLLLVVSGASGVALAASARIHPVFLLIAGAAIFVAVATVS